MRALLLLLCISLQTLCASSYHQPLVGAEFWPLGPFLAPGATNLKPGQISLLHAFIGLSAYGQYEEDWTRSNQSNIWLLTYNFEFEQGFSEKTGIEIIGTYTMRYAKGASSKGFNDTLVALGYQLADDEPHSWIPDFRIRIQAIVPTGKTDISVKLLRRALVFLGQEAFFIGPGLAYQKRFFLPDTILILHVGLSYNYPFKTRVGPLSIYGGGFETDGTIVPGHLIIGNVSCEYAFSKRWLFAADVFTTYQSATSRFQGFPGTTEEGTLAQVGLPASTQISITPSIEYSINSRMGWLFGSWATLAGKNASAFAGGFLCLSVMF